MTIVFVDKKWLDTIGDVRDRLVFREYPTHPTHIALLALRAKNAFPFVEAEVGNKMVSDERPFLPTYIPHSLVSAMFDVTNEQAQALGFGGKAA